MFIDADSVEKNSILEADICLVGSGAAGISFAKKLSDSGLQIVILESGKMSPDKNDQMLNDFETTTLPIDHTSRIRSFGGTTTAWSGKWKPHDPIDFSHRDWVPYSGWPIQRPDIDPYYEESAEILGFPHLESFKKSGKLFETPELTTSIFHTIEKSRLDFGKRFADAFEAFKNISVYIGANVVGFSSKNNVVEDAHVRTRAGNAFFVRAKTFVLACGGIENPRILLLSNLGNEHGQVGRYYMDHPKGIVGDILLKNQAENLSDFWGRKSPEGLTMTGIGLTEKAQRENRVLNSFILLYPIYARTEMLKIFPGPIKVTAHKLLKLALGNPKKIRSVSIRNYMEQAPVRENRVILSDTTDAFGNKIPKIDWSISDIDKRTMIVFQKNLKKECERIGLGTFESPLLEKTEMEWPISKDASHHMGTTRMGNDPKTSVVDRNCRIHSLNNFYIAGSSIFPTSGSAFPTMTIVALALRLADHIKQSHFS